MVSIHAPARGATGGNSNEGQANEVSIHAPARGATLKIKNHVKKYQGFNPRPRAGGDCVFRK